MNKLVFTSNGLLSKNRKNILLSKIQDYLMIEDSAHTQQAYYETNNQFQIVIKGVYNFNKPIDIYDKDTY